MRDTSSLHGYVGWIILGFDATCLIEMSPAGPQNVSPVSDSYTVRFYDGVVRTVKPTKVKPFQEVRNYALHPLVTAPVRVSQVCVCVWSQQNSEKTAVESEGWEDGVSEEERVETLEQKQKEAEDRKEAEKVTSDEKEGGENGEEERKRKAEHPSCPSPAKKKADESESDW